MKRKSFCLYYSDTTTIILLLEVVIIYRCKRHFIVHIIRQRAMDV